MKINSATLKAAAIVAVGVGAFLLYRKATGAVGSLVEAAQQALDETAAAVKGSWNNTVGAGFERAATFNATGYSQALTEKQILYGDPGYTGNDPLSGLPVIEGEWYSNEGARRYEAEQRAAGNTTPAYTSVNGAAFGLYPNMPSAANRNLLLTLQTRGRVVGGL